MKKITMVAFGLLFLAPIATSAHTGVTATSGFLHGALHPLTGLDHMIAMIAVGIWAYQLGRKSLWIVPTSFVSIMIIAGILGMSGVAIPLVEQGIIFSILTLGLLIAAAKKLPPWLSIIIVGLFAIFHGHAHGSEIPALASGASYALGFAIATASLHLLGIGIGFFVSKKMSVPMVRYVGTGIGLSGIILMLS